MKGNIAWSIFHRWYFNRILSMYTTFLVSRVSTRLFSGARFSWLQHDQLHLPVHLGQFGYQCYGSSPWNKQGWSNEWQVGYWDGVFLSPLQGDRIFHRKNTYLPLQIMSHKLWPQLSQDQTSTNRGPDSRFILEAVIKALISKSSWSSIMKTPNHVHLIHDF